MNSVATANVATMFGQGTDPVPFITAAFALGALGLFGFAIWVMLERRRVRQHLAALRQPTRR